MEPAKAPAIMPRLALNMYVDTAVDETFDLEETKDFTYSR